jgi:hypothetical protein
LEACEQYRGPKEQFSNGRNEIPMTVKPNSKKKPNSRLSIKPKNSWKENKGKLHFLVI